MQSVIFLYLVDNSEGTSWMILFGQGMGILIEAWKITKTVDVRVRQAEPGSWLPYKIAFEDKHQLSEVEKKTQEYDEIAFKYLYMVAVPLLLAYAGYSLLYESHKGWYSFIITTLVGSVYAYGFLMMVPSLYINYRLKVRRLSSLFPILIPPLSFLHPPTHANPPSFLLKSERRPHARQSHDLQVPQHLHRRPLRLHHQDAHAPPPRHPARRRYFLRLFVPEL